MPRRRLLPFLLCLFAAAPAATQVDRPRPAPTEAQQARIGALAARALAELATLPAAERPMAAGMLARNFIMLRRCSLAEPLLDAHPLIARSVAPTAYPAVLDGDRACADRLITRFAETLVPGETEQDAWTLYNAGALWRRIGRHAKADRAIRRAERFLTQEEARDPERAWSCHGGNCISSLWVTRIWAANLLRGSDQHRAHLRWLGTLALSLSYEREIAESARPYMSQSVFEQLLPQAIDAGDDGLAQLLADGTVYGYPKAYAGARMRRLLAEGRVAEALELWPTAQAAFQTPVAPDLFRANLPLFHRHREQMGARYPRGEMLSLLAAIWIERGEPERAREALATARASPDWRVPQVERLRAVEAMLEDGADPVGAVPVLPDRDHIMGELAALLAATGRRAEARRALALIRSPGVRQSILAELPCRVAYSGDSATAFAVERARGHLRPGNRNGDGATTFRSAVRRTFLCLIRAHRGEAAIAYLQAIEDPEQRFGLAVEMPLDSGIAGETALRRRFAGIAFALAESRNLWGNRMVASMAADFERAGDVAMVDRVLARTRGEIRMEVYDRLLKVHAPLQYF